MITGIQKPKGILRFSLAILLVYLMTSHFYLFKSGIPQISHYILFFGIVVLLFTRFMQGAMRLGKAEYAALTFGFFTFLINMIHFLALPDPMFLASSFFYVFDALIFVFVVMLFREAPSQTLRVVYIGVALSILSQIIYIQFFPDYEAGRVQGSFNNPNQLSYWALFSGCALLLARSYTKLRWHDLALFFGIAYVQALALSKAGLIAFGILAATLPFSRMMPMPYKGAFFFLSAFAVIVLLLGFSEITQTGPLQNVIGRIDTIGHEADDTLAARGYLRPVQYWHHVILGAGEGGYGRFFDMPGNLHLEIHSGLLNILFSYGIGGFVIFMIFLYTVLRQAPRYFWIILFVIMLNGLTHQNIRFTYFWIVMGVAYGTRYVRIEEQDKEP